MNKELTSFLELISKSQQIMVKQLFEPIELVLNWETKNRYLILDENNNQIAIAIEKSKGPMDHLGRIFLGHWRSFEVIIFDNNQNPILKLQMPWQFFMRTLFIKTLEDEVIGQVVQKFSIFYKKFNLFTKSNIPFAKINSPFLKFWTFEIHSREKKLGTIQKKYTGLFSELATDKDDFKLNFASNSLSDEQKLILLSTVILIDIVYFERKQN